MERNNSTHDESATYVRCRCALFLHFVISSLVQITCLHFRSLAELRAYDATFLVSQDLKNITFNRWTSLEQGFKT